MNEVLGAVAVFCGARTGDEPSFANVTRELAALLATNKITTVYGGGNVGLMGVLADAALERGGKVVGVIPESMVETELAHQGLTELHVVQTMHERKALMAVRADAFVALPGGVGTLDEIFEAITWQQLAIHEKPIGFLDLDGFYAPLRSFLVNAASHGFVPARTMERIVFETTPHALLERLRARAAGN